jgi:GTP cyclohydrolase I
MAAVNLSKKIEMQQTTSGAPQARAFGPAGARARRLTPRARRGHTPAAPPGRVIRARPPARRHQTMNEAKVASLFREILVELGEDPEREGMLKTPERVAKALKFLTSGLRTTMDSGIKGAVFKSEANNMIIVRDIEVYSMCEHHMLPFFGRCHIGYVATDRVLGVSKLARILDFYARRPQIQERLTAQIAKSVKELVGAEGVGVVMECRHLCMMMRGVEKQNSLMTTSSVLGSFHDEQTTRMEFMELVNGRRSG